MASALITSADGSLLLEVYPTLTRAYSTRTYKLMDEYCTKCLDPPHEGEC